MSSKGCQALLGLLLLVGSGAAWASGAAGIVFDPANFGKNTISAAEQIRQTAQQVKQYYLQFKQYQTEVQNLRSFNAKDLSLYNYRDELSGLKRLYNQLNLLYGTVNSSQSLYTKRLRLLSASGLTWQQYKQREELIAQTEDGSRALAFKQDRQALANVQDQYQKAQALENKIPQTKGLHQSLNLMNRQMNQLVQQNTTLTKLIATKGMNSMAAQQDASAEQKAMDAREQKIEDAQNAVVNNWSKKYPTNGTGVHNYLGQYLSNNSGQ